MGVPVSVRLEDDVKAELEAQAQARGIGLATFLRDLATTTAREAKRQRIRQASAEVAAHIHRSPEAQAFVEDWGTPATNV